MSDLIDRSKQEEKEKEVEKRKKRDDADLRWVLSAPQGRRFCVRLLAKGRLYKGSFTGSSQTFFFEGIRDFGLWILEIIMSADPKAFFQMHNEYKSELMSKEKDDDRRKH